MTIGSRHLLYLGSLYGDDEETWEPIKGLNYCMEFNSVTFLWDMLFSYIFF